MRLLLAAGGSAGHIEPALTLADTMSADDPRLQIVVLGTQRGLESDLVPARGYRLRTVPAAPLPRALNRELVRTPGRIAGSVREVRRVLREEAPDVVVGFGGYVALPAYLAARRAGIPLVVHEANARPGLANRVGARLTPWVAVAHRGVLPHSAHIGMPLRAAIRTLAEMDDDARAQERERCRAQWGLAPDRPTLLAFGGSLGARRINAAMAEAQASFADHGIQVVHLTGKQGHGLPASWPPVREADAPRYVSLDYLADIHVALAVADLAIVRAGAMTCAELAAVGLAGVYVPLPVGNGEQALNAREVVTAGGGIIVDDADFGADAVRSQVIPLLLDAPRRASMGRIAREHAVVDADRRLAEMVRAAAALGGKPTGSPR